MTTVFQRLKGDSVIWMTALFLGLISLLAVYSSISSLALKPEGGRTLHFLLKHGLMLASGGAIIHYASRLRYGMYSRLAQLAIWATAGLLLLTLLIGDNLNDASRWITIPIINQSFQTSDLAKVRCRGGASLLHQGAHGQGRPHRGLHRYGFDRGSGDAAMASSKHGRRFV